MIQAGSKVRMKTNEKHEKFPDFYPNNKVIGTVLEVDSNDLPNNTYVDWGKESKVSFYKCEDGTNNSGFAWFCDLEDLVEVE